ncbi:type III-B CRISPR module-associated protein Cmr3 [Chloroflexus sp.]|uniref:type III-B CRISPR module-associated protein Cmr3 n=1 Tax=Chloroflexus sp. TaxID=1904827 RepID=UPI0026200103|nr:type III-B CRISPR module-associated protein Cmr3 [uncultured Chloroflexus sp.]
MPTWIIEPRDPLIARDGRPFGPDPGARARSLSFPFPSTVTGGARKLYGLSADGVFDTAKVNDVLKMGVRGPLLAMLRDDGSFQEWLLPAPADALLLRAEAASADPRRLQLVPLQLPDGSVCAMPRGGEPYLVGPRRIVNEKPLGAPPRFWYWSALLTWLEKPADGPCSLQELGIGGLLMESRTHVAIEPTTQTAEEGRLFQTSGLEFTGPERKRLALIIESGHEFPHWSGGLAPLGGERRLVAWRQIKQDFPACPPEVRQQIIKDRACRVILLTPAHFTQGYRPTWLLEARHGVQPTLQAAAIARPQVVSGWDLNIGKPKPTRRLAPAGSVYFLTLTASDDEVIQRWIDAIWMQNISDAPQDRLDGFGLAALGVWNGNPVKMEVSS